VLEWKKRLLMISNKIDSGLAAESVKLFNGFVKPFLNARVIEIMSSKEEEIIPEEVKQVSFLNEE
jgi:hypothetical protein